MEKDTPIQRFRASNALWTAYGRALNRATGKKRSEDLVAYMRRYVQRHGDAEDKALLAEADAEVAARLKRKHAGRPKTVGE